MFDIIRHNFMLSSGEKSMDLSSSKKLSRILTPHGDVP